MRIKGAKTGRIFCSRYSNLRWPTTVTAKGITSRQKEKPHGKRNNFMAKVKDSW